LQQFRECVLTLNYGSFHWAILVGPKNEKGDEVPGRRYAVVPITTADPTKFAGWRYEEKDVPNVKNAPDLLARVLVAKIEDEGRLNQILRETPVKSSADQWSCRLWVADVLRRLERDENGAVGTSVLSWSRIEALVQKYVATKAENGTYSKPGFEVLPSPTWNMLVSREAYP
jgi:hypothetical protein